MTDAPTMSSFFRTIMRKLMKVTSDPVGAPDALTEGGKTVLERRCTFLQLLLALESGLDTQALEMLFKVPISNAPRRSGPLFRPPHPASTGFFSPFPL